MAQVSIVHIRWLDVLFVLRSLNVISQLPNAALIRDYFLLGDFFFLLAYATLVHNEMNAMWPCPWSWRLVLKVMGRKSSFYPAPPHNPNPCSCTLKTTPLGFQEQLCFGAIYYPWSWRVMATVVDRKPSSSLPKKCEILSKDSVNRSQRWKKVNVGKGKRKTEQVNDFTYHRRRVKRTSSF